MDLVCDQGIALFAGLNVVPKRSYLASYSSQRRSPGRGPPHGRLVRRGATGRLATRRFHRSRFPHRACQHAGRTAGKTLYFQPQPCPAGRLVFLARDAAARVLCYAHAGIPKDQKAAEILRFADFWQERTGSPPAELVFDSQLTTYEHLHQLNQRGIGFLTLRRRTRPMLGRIWSLPASAWRRITLPSLTRTFRTPRVLDERVPSPRLRRPSAPNHGDRSGPRGADHPADQQPPSRLSAAGDPLCPTHADRERHLRGRPVLSPRCLVVHGRHEGGLRLADHPDGQCPVSPAGQPDWPGVPAGHGQEDSSATCWTCRPPSRLWNTKWSSPWTSGLTIPSSSPRDSRTNRPPCPGSATSAWPFGLLTSQVAFVNRTWYRGNRG